MVKTRSSARVGSAVPSAPSENGTTSELRTRLKTTENGHRSQKSGNNRNNQALPSGGTGHSGGSQGKDPLAPALPGSRNMYQHPAVTGYNPQDSRAQAMPVTQTKEASELDEVLEACLSLARQNPMYAGGMYHYGHGAGSAALTSMPSLSPSTQMPPFPVHPDVKFKKLPFYDVMAELMKPSTMMPMQAGRLQEGTYIFHLTPQQATEIASGKDLVGPSNKLDFVIQAQLRFCLLETSCEQEDYFPPSVNVKVNNKMCPLPNPIPTNKPTPEPKRPPRPVNISSLVKLSPTVANTIHVTWAADFTRAYVVSVFMVRKLTSAELLQRLKNKGTKNPDYTRSLIKEKLSEDYDSEIATTSLRVSLMCPLGKMRMACPCRPANCPHLQCFDASLFLQMNERKPTWLCPVCDRPAPYDSLVVDGYFQEVLTSSRLASECNEIQLHADGSWSAHAPPARAPAPLQPTPEPVTLIADDLDVIPVEGGSSGGAKRAAVGETRAPKATEAVVDLTSDSEDELPLKRKVPAPKATPPVPETAIKTDETFSNSEAVSSSGYRSPTESGGGGSGAVISLDSPSPPAPASPQPAADSLPDHPHLSITPVDRSKSRRRMSRDGSPAAPASPLPNADALAEHPHLSITPVDRCTNNTERDEGEAAPAHWAPYAESDRETHDSYRRY
ncbi:E3 SUMO-protein ligase PIAS2 isoform X3 [Ostrinia furnacalis]|uniref:E3 SUMO-protein ligase PIAS2 isoform X3 n=1 Tax=Ostrinia furnacalis TaxID=93504 RepID=UPI00103F5EC8|nr:E3 SUMO-protein ligase PIAS2 isoform X3 [Ostrinia furnacalis]